VLTVHRWNPPIRLLVFELFVDHERRFWGLFVGACACTHAPTHGSRACTSHARAHPHTHQHKGGEGVEGGGAGFQIGDLELGENVGEEQQLWSSYGKMDGMRAVK